jgi:crotonobetaine/carnitine-CoA ligase
VTDPATVPELLARRAEEFPDRVYLHCGTATRTYREMRLASERGAAGLAGLGVEPGDRVALLLPNRVEMAELFFGCARLGAVQVPLNTYLKGDFLRYQVHDCAAGTIVLDRPGLAALTPLINELPDLRRIVLVESGSESDTESDTEPDTGSDRVPVVGYHRLPTGSDLPAPPGPGRLCTVMYTSGTTGMPKGCQLSHRYVLHVGRAWARSVCEFRPGDMIMTPLPMYHTSGQSMGLVAALLEGLTVAIEPSFSASGFLPRAIELSATVVLGVGAMAHALLSIPESALDRAHRLRLAQWTPLGVPEQQAFERRFGCVVRGQGYGQTECVPISFSAPSGTQHPATCGAPAPWLDVAVVDELDHPVPVGSTGEIVVRPREPGVMFDGYWGKPADTLATFRNLWHHTGDFGRLDADGQLVYVDRKKDAIRRRGENVSSVQVEQAILSHPKVAEVAVHAVASAATEDDIKACVVAAPGATLTAEELFEHFAGLLPYFAVPRYVELVPALPRNALGRVQKHRLRAAPHTPATWDLEQLGLTVRPEQRR